MKDPVMTTAKPGVGDVKPQAPVAMEVNEMRIMALQLSIEAHKGRPLDDVMAGARVIMDWIKG